MTDFRKKNDSRRVHRSISATTIQALCIYCCLLFVVAPAIAAERQTEPGDDDLVIAAGTLREDAPSLFQGAQGIVVVSVLPGSQADKAGLLRGDIIVKYGNDAISTAEQFMKLVENTGADKEVELEYVREIRKMSATVKGGKIGIGLEDTSRLSRLKTYCAMDKTLKICSSLALIYSPETKTSLGRAITKRLQKKHEAAIDEYKYMISLAPDLPEAYGRVGWLLIEDGRLADALDYNRKAYDRQPDSPTWSRNLGHIFMLQGDMDMARAYYRKSLSLISSQEELSEGPIAEFDLFAREGRRSEACREWGEWFRKGFSELQEAEKLNNLALQLSVDGKHKEAIAKAQEALLIRDTWLDSEHPGVVDSLDNLARLYFQVERYSDAEISYKRILAIRGKNSGPEFPATAEILNNMAILYKTTQRYAEAEPLYMRVLSIKEKSLGLEHPDTAITLLDLTTLYLYTNRAKEAKSLLSRAVDILMKSVPDAMNKACNNSVIIGLKKIAMIYEIFSAKDLSIEAISEHLSGDCQYKMSFYDKAILEYEKALNLYSKLNMYNLQGDICFKMGSIYNNKNDYAKSFEFYHKALACYEHDQSKPHYTFNSSKVLLALAGLCSDTGDYAGSEKLYEEARTGFEKSANLWGQGVAYLGMGENSYRKRDYDTAMNLCQKALPLLEKVEHKETLGWTYLLMGLISVEGANFNNAMEFFVKSGALFKTSLDKDMTAQLTVLYGIGKVSLGRRDFEGALSSFTESETRVARLGNKEQSAILKMGKAEAFDKLGKTKDALENYEAALELFEKVRRNASFDDYKKNYLRRMSSNFNSAADFMIRQGLDDKGFRAVESTKARIFLDRLAEGRVNLEKGIDPVLRKQRDELENEIALLRRSKEQSLASSIKENKDLYYQIASSESRLEEVVKSIRLANPLYASVEYPEMISVQEVQKKVLHKDEVLVEYFLTNDKVYCFVVSSEQFNVIKLPAGKHDVETWVRSFLNSFTKTAQSGKLHRFDESSAKKLYKMLIKPVTSHFRSRNVIIVPDGILAKLPFEALVDPDHETSGYLIEKYNIKYVQSASVLRLLRTYYKTEETTDSFIGFGDPVYNYNNFKAGKEDNNTQDGQMDVSEAKQMVRGSYLRSGGTLPRLKGSGEEVRTIAALYNNKKERAKVLLRLDAREEFVKTEEMSRYGYIHFSTHGLLSDNFQAIALSQIPESKEDGFLTLGELMNCTFKAKLVVLSACETGLGKIEEGEGVTGLTRAVMQAGTPAVVASLWSVSDLGTIELMVRLYENLIKKGMKKTDALREAKLALIADDNYRHPYYWSAFVLYGE